MMPSPPYDNSPLQSQQQFGETYPTAGTGYQQYDAYTEDPTMTAPMSNGYPTQYEPQLPQTTTAYGVSGQYMPQQCPLPRVQGGFQFPSHHQQQHQSCSMNNSTFSMQATVFTASPESSTICYQPPNLTDLQFPTTEPVPYPGYQPQMPTATAGMGQMNRGYIDSARQRYARVACPTQAPTVHIGSKRSRETTGAPQQQGISEWSTQWLQGTTPAAHVY